MASVLDLVRYYQHNIEKYPHDEQKVLKAIDKLFSLDVKVSHLQETGVGRTVNALRKEPGHVGKAARALVYKWKEMVAAEESDQETDHDTAPHIGHEKNSVYNANASMSQTTKHEEKYKPDSTLRQGDKDHRQNNGDLGTSKRKYQSSEEEESESKRSRHSSSHSHHSEGKRKQVEVKSEPSDHSSDDSQSDSQNDDSDSESSDEHSEEETKVKIKTEPEDKHDRSLTKYPQSSHIDHKRESSNSKKPHESSSHTHYNSKHHNSDSSKYNSDSKHSEKVTTKDKHSSKEKSSKEKESSSDRSYMDHKSSDEKKNKEESKSKHSSERHKSSSQKTENGSERHKSQNKSVNKEKHSSSSSEKDKYKNTTDKDKQKNSSDKEKDKDKTSSENKISSDKRKPKENSSKHKSSSSKEKLKDKSSSKEKSSSSNHKSDKKHTTEKSRSESKSKSERNEDLNKKESSQRSSSSSSKSKSSSSKSKEEIPKKKVKINEDAVDSDEGIGCESGTSFAEALGMITPSKSKKKNLIKGDNSPGNPVNNDLSPANLLAPTAKLAPLPSIEISALPEISPNYKPRPPPKFLPHFTDEDAISAGISTKNQRTKVYSGNKVIGKVPTLYEMCVLILQEHIDALEYTGGVPYEILKPVVDKATPQQLHMLEHYNPYLMDDTDHLWQKHCERHFRGKKRQELETWREMFARCQEEQEHRLKSLTANIKMTQEAKKAPIKQTKMAYVDSVVKPPRSIARKQALHGTAHASSASPAARVAALATAPNVLKTGSVRPPPGPSMSSSSANRPKKAPLMQKALQFMRGRKR